uniref:Reverse transcriptase domain-containing protein n=1 Tax=Tanacetum cinerariifolium TaxID=118510 RepID=A0A699HRG5_TANCI|nr:reverse transcriptase domain-containing protein [Tanacetum cinerariifolium]
MEVDIEEDENEPELTYPYKEVDPLNPLPPASESKLKDVTEDSDGLLPGLMRRDINSLFGRMDSLSRRLYGHETEHALVEKKGKARDEYYGKLILDLGNEVCSSVEQGTTIMEKLVEKIGNAEDRAECKKLKKELEEARGFVFEERPNEAIDVLVKDEKCPSSKLRGNIDAAIDAKLARHANDGNDARGSGPVRGQDVAPAVKGKKVKFVAATLQGPSVTWWNAKNNQKQGNSQAMTTAPPAGKVSSGLLLLCKCCFTRHVGPCTIKCHKCGKVGYKARYCKEKNVKQEETKEVCGRACAIKDAEPQGPNVVTSTFLLSNHYASVLFDLSFDRSFVDTRFSSMLNIDLVKIRASYEVELADVRIVSTNTVLKGCTLNLVNHILEIDLMPIGFETFDVIMGMDWLVKHDAVIVYGEKVVRIPCGNKMLIVKSDKGVSRLTVISCIKARKYVERGCHLFLVHVMEKKSIEKRSKDVPIIRDFPEVFPEDFPGLPPPRQIEF